MNKRLAAALAIFAALAAVASFVLHGKVLAIVLILYGYFAIRTFIADKMRAQRDSELDSLRDEASHPETGHRLTDPEAERR